MATERSICSWANRSGSTCRGAAFVACRRATTCHSLHSPLTHLRKNAARLYSTPRFSNALPLSTSSSRALSPTGVTSLCRDKIICKLTGVVLNKKEDAVWKHMLGKKFEQKLAEKEAEKGIAREDVEMTETASEKPGGKSDISRGGSKARRREKETIQEEELIEDEQADANSDGSDFWAPPAGARWDFDTGSSDRWSLPPSNDPDFIQPVHLNGHTSPAAREGGSSGSNGKNGDFEMLDGEVDLKHSGSSSDSDGKLCVKRISTSSLPRKQKKRAKRSKREPRMHNGV